MAACKLIEKLTLRDHVAQRPPLVKNVRCSIPISREIWRLKLNPIKGLISGNISQNCSQNSFRQSSIVPSLKKIVRTID